MVSSSEEARHASLSGLASGPLYGADGQIAVHGPAERRVKLIDLSP